MADGVMYVSGGGTHIDTEGAQLYALDAATGTSPSLLVVDHIVPEGRPDQPLGVWARGEIGGRDEEAPATPA